MSKNGDVDGREKIVERGYWLKKGHQLFSEMYVLKVLPPPSDKPSGTAPGTEYSDNLRESICVKFPWREKILKGHYKWLDCFITYSTEVTSLTG